MITLSKSIMAFGLLGAIAVGTATPSDARTYRGVYAHGGYGMYPRNYPNRYVRPFVTWNPYGARWEGTD